MHRRGFLSTIGATFSAVLSGCLGGRVGGLYCEVACFEFDFVGWDDAPSQLTIRHTGGRNLPSDEVFIGGKPGYIDEYRPINEEKGSRGKVVKPGYEWDDNVGSSDGIGGAEFTLDFDPVIEWDAESYKVQIFWQHDNETEIIGEWLRTWQGYDE